MVSDTTLMSMPANGLAASWNHLSSATCWSWLRVLGVNSLSAASIAALRSTGGLASAEEPLPAPAELPALPAVPSCCFLPQPLATRTAVAAIIKRLPQLENDVLVRM